MGTPARSSRRPSRLRRLLRSLQRPTAAPSEFERRLAERRSRDAKPQRYTSDPGDYVRTATDPRDLFLA